MPQLICQHICLLAWLLSCVLSILVLCCFVHVCSLALWPFLLLCLFHTQVDLLIVHAFSMFLKTDAKSTCWPLDFLAASSALFLLMSSLSTYWMLLRKCWRHSLWSHCQALIVCFSALSLKVLKATLGKHQMKIHIFTCASAKSAS